MSETEMSKVNKTVVMRVTPDEAAKLRYQRKFDAAWAKEQRQVAAAGITLLGPQCCTVDIDGEVLLAEAAADPVPFPPAYGRFTPGAS